MNFKKTNISAIVANLVVAMSIAYTQELFPETWEKWVVYLITLAGSFGIAGTGIGLTHKAVKGEAIIKENPIIITK